MPGSRSWRFGQSAGVSPTGPIGPVRLAPQRALPVARLPQQVIPLDLLVVLRVEQIDVRRHVVAHVVVDVANQPVLPRQADHRRQERLRDAVGHVDAPRLAPLGDDVAVAGDQAARRAAVLDRPDHGVERLVAEAVLRGSAMSCVPGVSAATASFTASASAPVLMPTSSGLLVLPVEALGEVGGLLRGEPRCADVGGIIGVPGCVRRLCASAGAITSAARTIGSARLQHDRAPCEAAV